jgi:hypothetical protein
MTNEEAIKWLTNLKQDIGSLRHENLWPYAQAIDEMIEMFEDRIQEQKNYKYGRLSPLYPESWLCPSKSWYET